MDADLRSPSSSDEEFMDCGAGDGGTPPVVTPQQMAMLATGYGDLNLGQKQMWQDIPSFTDNSVPQTMPLSADQVLNNAGGFVYAVDDRIRVRRFLILGTTGGTYYVKEQALTLENAQDLLKLIQDDKAKTILDELYEIDRNNRAPKQTPLIFCLALAAKRAKDQSEDKRTAYRLFSQICRIPTHVFQYVEFSEKLSAGGSTGWGRGQRDIIGDWYLTKKPLDLAMAVTKYKQRNDWSHRDLLRLAHPRPMIDVGGDNEKKKLTAAHDRSEHSDIFLYCTKGFETLLEKRQEFLLPAEPKRFKNDAPAYLRFLEAVEMMKKCNDETLAVKLINEFGLVREHVPTEMLSNKEVWKTLLKKMPMTAMIRNLGKMSSLEILKPGADESKLVCNKLKDEKALQKARIHPLSVLLASAVYRAGRGDKGKLQWTPNNDIVNALNDAFYKTFSNVKSTGRKFLLALDVSGSMGSAISGSALSCKEASGAMAMVTLRTEPLCEVVAFQNQLTELKLKKEMRLDEVLKTISGLPFGSTDCSLPMLWAAQKQKKFDCFVVYTDNETYFGGVHPAEALHMYRQKSGIWDAKLIVIGMTATKFTIADPKDPFMLDIVGFDSAAPELMRNFVLGWDSAPLRHVGDTDSDDDRDEVAADDDA